jgi:hypothetical protein
MRTVPLAIHNWDRRSSLRLFFIRLERAEIPRELLSDHDLCNWKICKGCSMVRVELWNADVLLVPPQVTTP